jgi:tetratricopeptide (TPR) repeat protein
MPTLPAVQGQTLAEGIRPRDNSFTRAAETLLNQALSAETDAEKANLYGQALDETTECKATDVDNPKCFYQSALANVGLKNYTEAKADFDKAEELHPRYVLETEVWRERAWVDAYNDAIVPLNGGDLETAVGIFEAANAIYPQRPEAFLQVGSVYSRLSRPDDAATAFQTAIGLLEESRALALADTTLAETWEQHWEIARSGLGQALQLAGRYQEAADLFGEMLADTPDDPALIGSLASVLTELEMTDSVDVLYHNLLNRPGLTEFDFANAGVGLYRIGEYERAAQAFRSAADMNPFNRDARLNLTQTYYGSENWEAVIPSAQELLEVDPLNGMVWIILARAYSELENDEDAGRVFNEYQAIGYEVEEIMLAGGATGGATVSGVLKNTTAEPGGTVTLRFHFGGMDGQEIGTTEIRVQIPAVEESVEFMGDFNSSETVTGYMYEVVG